MYVCGRREEGVGWGFCGGGGEEGAVGRFRGMKMRAHFIHR